MHGRIIELSTNPICDPMTDFDIELHEIPIADYITNIDEGTREREIADFVKHLRSTPGAEELVELKDGDTIVFHSGFTKAWTRSAFTRFRYQLMRAWDITEDTFCDKAGWAVTDISDSFKDECGYYIYDDYAKTFGEWVMCGIEEDVPYYIGGILDYHW